jgi:hypothetical protein
MRLLSTMEKTAVGQQAQVGINTKLMTRPGNVGGGAGEKRWEKNQRILYNQKAAISP